LGGGVEGVDGVVGGGGGGGGCNMVFLTIKSQHITKY